MILYEGPSQIDQSPIVVIATGHERKSKNSKTGPMVQVWILKADANPVSAIMNGGDRGICGNCRHRGPLGARSCYVNVGKAPSNVYRAYKKGLYERASDLVDFGRNRTVRLGAYGDPGAVPHRVWDLLLRDARGWTGYTHEWRNRPDLKQWCMASTDTLGEQQEAQQLGWRTFRSTTQLLMRPNEIFCPASEEMGKKTTCHQCMLCNGQSGRAKNIAIMIHGVGKKRYQEHTA